MKLKEIKNIVKYKSFEKYCWKTFFNSDSFHVKANILFGENGSGKSSICNILKSVCNKKSFSDEHNPSSVLLKFEDEECSYNGRVWIKQKSCNDILFFDKEFIQENIHLGSIRGSVKDGQEQKSGKMIIEFDKKAIQLRTDREEAKKIKDEYSINLKQFKELHNKILNFNMTESQKEFYEQLENITSEELQQIYDNIPSKLTETQNLIKKDNELDQKTTEIQNTLNELENEAFNLSLSDISIYQSLFNFNLTEASEIQAEENLITKIKTKKDFFQAGIDVISNYPDKCPFCQSSTEGENISKIIRLYNEIYDDTYKQQLDKFNYLKQILSREIEDMITYVNNYDINQNFDILNKYHNSFKIDGLFSIEEKETFIKPSTSSLSILLKKLDDLHKPNFEDITEKYDRMKNEYDNIVEFFSKLNNFYKTKNKIITDFKNENSAEQIRERIAENKNSITELNDISKFLADNIIDNQKDKLSKEEDLEKLKSQLKEKETNFTKAQISYTDYCRGNVFQTTLDKMIVYFNKFNFPFSLELKSDNIGRRTEYPFSFIVKDSAGSIRDFKEGLSEGELQVLSICFFFAFLDIQDHLEDKILIFDDPISSLDNNYISSLVDLVFNEHKKFSQTFIFTHNQTFFKFLRKQFDSENANEYNILRNSPNLGGSYICKSTKKNFVEKLKKFELNIYSKATAGHPIDIESKIIEYGQYLRYEVERFIKNKLLFWDADRQFSKALSGIKESRNKLSTEDLDCINEIYKFCNWTTSHVDVGDNHGLEQLKIKINEFVNIYSLYP